MMTVYSKRVAEVRAWLGSGAPLPLGQAFSRVGDPFETEPVPADGEFTEYVAANGHSGHLSGELIELEYEFEPNGYVRITLVDADCWRRPTVLAHAASLIEHFAGSGAVFAFACPDDEFYFRNLLQVDLWGDGRMSGGLLGQDISQVIPGLYWLTYFDSALAAERGIDVAALAAGLHAEQINFASGTALKLYPDPADWIQHRDAVGEALLSNAGFFAMSRVRPPDKSSAAAFARYIEAVSKEWP